MKPLEDFFSPFLQRVKTKKNYWKVTSQVLPHLKTCSKSEETFVAKVKVTAGFGSSTVLPFAFMLTDDTMFEVVTCEDQ